jgi:phage shock protein PspC (stress-responsive transcriptional regulator)
LFAHSLCCGSFFVVFVVYILAALIFH